RPLLLLDGHGPGGFPAAQQAAALRRLRRDADLHGAVVLCTEAQALSAQWRALCAPRPAGQTAHVILWTSAALPMPAAPIRARRGEGALSPRLAEVRAPEAAQPANAGAPGAPAAAAQAEEGPV